VSALHDEAKAQALCLVRFAHQLIPIRREVVVEDLIAFTLIYLDQLPDPYAAAAQDQPPSPVSPPFVGGGTIPPTDLPSGIGNYCIYQSLIFSIGSPICVGKTSFVCAPTTDKLGFNQRGYWTVRPNDPNLVSTPVCE
jgi:hypothetical protein